jgi:NAD(P)-dependent dehydrogenase (short-subunit alcohol dehydrogenase family)
VSDLSSLDNKIAVITGAAGSIGRESVRVFQERGATVVGVDIQGDCDADLFLMASAWSSLGEADC